MKRLLSLQLSLFNKALLRKPHRFRSVQITPFGGTCYWGVRFHAATPVGQSNRWTHFCLPSFAFPILLCQGSTPEVSPEVPCPPCQNPKLSLNLLWILSAQKRHLLSPFLKATHPGWPHSPESPFRLHNNEPCKC